MNITDQQFAAIQPQFKQLAAEWRARAPWIQAIGIRDKLVANKPIGQDAITFYVGQKLPDVRLDASSVFPQSIRIPRSDITLPTDVIEMPPFRFVSGPTCSSARPAHGGDCIGALGVGETGTLGAVMRRKSDRATFIITASHAVVGVGGRYSAVHDVCHPPVGPSIGVVSRSVSWSTLGNMQADAALVQVTSNPGADPDIAGVPKLTGSGTPTLNQPVRFRGTNGLKYGKVICTWKLILFADAYGFDNTFLIDAVAEPGDSGSVVGSDAGDVLGIVFASNGITSACSYFEAVSRELGLSDYEF